ncbi:tyrosine-type recombinase/integrase [Geodermatophilus sp. URMC 63]
MTSSSRRSPGTCNGGSPDPDRLLVTNRLGAPLRRSSFGHCWQIAVEACELPRGTWFHDLRHLYASALVGAGLHPRAIQTRLGHATISETMDTTAICSRMPRTTAAGRSTRSSARLMCPQGLPSSEFASQKRGDGRVGLYAGNGCPVFG